MKRGFISGSALGMAALAFVALIGAGILLMVYLFISGQLATSLNNANTTIVNNNLNQAAINFTNQLGTVGTIAGVALILLIVAAVGFVGYGVYQGGRGRGSGV